MTIVLTSAPPTTPRPRQYRNREERVAMVQPLLEILAKQPGLTAKDIRSEIDAVARLHQCRRETVIRAVNEALAPAPPSRAFEPSREALVTIAQNGGNAMDTFPNLKARGLAPSYPTLMRGINALDPALLQVMKHGAAALEKYLIVGTFEPEGRNVLWAMDAMHVPIKCRSSRGTVFKNLNLLSAFDVGSRLCVAHMVCEGAPTTADALQVLRAGVLGRELDLIHLSRLLSLGGIERIPGDGPFLLGGRPEGLITDNGSIFVSDEFEIQAGRIITGMHTTSRPYIAADRGAHERWHWTLQLGWISALPGYLDGAQPRKGDPDKIAPYAMPADRDLPPVEAVTDALDAAIEDYNFRHVVSTTGEIPAVRYLADRAPQLSVEPASLWDVMPEIGRYTVQRTGVHVDGWYRTNTQVVARFRGSKVPVRGFIGSPGRLFVGDMDGRYLGEVKSDAERTDAERRADARSNQTRGAMMRGVLRESAARSKSEAGVAGGSPDEPVATKASRRTAKPKLVADPKAALLEDWDPERLELGAA